MNTSGIRRNFKNIVHNYSEAQVKVREATSNDPWGPSSTLMSEIADYSYNVVAFSEIMQLIWKRLNDHGKNWRHVYKALVLLEYLIKTGTEKVAQQCKENIFAIQTLKDFQFFEENKDHGMNVREKAKQLVALLKDDERLKNERTRALKARERFAQAAALGATEIPAMGRGLGGSGGSGGSSLGDGYQYQEAFGDSLSSIPTRTGMYPPPVLGADNRMSMGMDVTVATGQPQSLVMNHDGVDKNAELECARPQTAGEEELQLQLALAMSKEEAEQEEQKRRSDDVRLQMAITQSEEDFGTVQSPGYLSNGASSRPAGMNNGAQKQSNLLDLMDMPLPGPSTPSMPVDPWGLPVQQQQRPPPPRIPQFQSSESSSLNDLLGLDTRVPTNVPLPPLPSTTTTTTYPYPPLLGFPEVTQPTDPWSPVNMSRSTTTSPMNTDPFLGRPSSSLGVPASDAFSRPPQPDPWSLPQPAPDPWGGATSNNASFGSSPSLATNGDAHAFDQLGTSSSSSKSTNNLDSVGGAFSAMPTDPFSMGMGAQSKKTPENFLGENSNLVNLDSLISSKPPSQMPGSTNPFALPTSTFQTQQPPRVSLNQMRTQQQFGEMSSLSYAGATNDPFAPQLLPTPLVPANQMATTAGGGGGSSMANNPFL